MSKSLNWTNVIYTVPPKTRRMSDAFFAPSKKKYTLCNFLCIFMVSFIDRIILIITDMLKLLGNIIWIVFGGLEMALGYLSAGLVLCLTIIGIPFGVQVFKIAILALLPFGQKGVTPVGGGGCLSMIMNVIWVILAGWWLALGHLLLGLLFCITIIGIPFGMAHFKLCSLALFPFGKEISIS